MRRILFLVFLLAGFGLAEAQDKLAKDSTSLANIKAKAGAKAQRGAPQKDSVHISQYKIISFQRDTTHLDTTLGIHKEYKYNYLRKDNFELLRFSNVGQTYNTLSHSFDKATLYPALGVRAKHFNYMEVDDIDYYHVPTATTDLFFKTTMEQGQLLDAFITANTSKRLNFSIAYKGLRSLGKYQNILTSTGNFRFTANYRTADDKYKARGHIVTQDMLNQENGGLTEDALTQFLAGTEEFIDRSRLDVRFRDAENLLIGKRYFIDHSYAIARKKDSTSQSNLKVHHTFNYETKFYRYDQDANNDYFGDAFAADKVNDRAQLRTMFNQAGVSFGNNIIGDIKAKASHYRYHYFFKSVVVTSGGSVIPNKLEGDEIALGGEWSKKIGGFHLNADLMVNLSGEQGGSYLKANAGYKVNNDVSFEAAITSSSRLPNFNFQLYQSDYRNYNWYNPGLQKEKVQNASFELRAPKWINAKVDYSILDNYTYFGESGEQVDGTNILSVPLQSSSTINYLRVKVQREFRLGKFALDNTVMYQNVSQPKDILNVPQLITRNTLYFSDHLFKKAMFLQTGITFNYFTKYKANAYNPLIGEFYTQEQTEIGGFPRLDFFVNAKVRQTRIYVKAEHFNSSFTGYDFFSAPNYPYRDFIVRFGLVWNFFR